MKAHLFDIYHLEEKIFLWLRTPDGEMHLFWDIYYPTIYIDGEEHKAQKIINRLRELKALKEEPTLEERKIFYTNQSKLVHKLIISKPSILKKIYKKLYVFYGILDIYHTDIDLLSHYMYYKNIFPLCELEFTYKNNKILEIHSLENLDNLEYKVPSLKTLEFYLKTSARLRIQKENPLIMKTPIREYEIYHSDPLKLISKVNAVLEIEDPDIILSSFGDQIILPQLYKISQEYKVPLLFDRDRNMKKIRNVLAKGTSYNTYGNWIFRAPAYPLFGRWHIDSSNSFVYKETQLMGILELARLSRIPVQKLSRSSTGTALTNIETFVAIDQGYLVPWQKSSLENPKTAYELLRIDKGGLIFQPSIEKTKVYENIAQLDYSQMYPSIMVNHNISPETINCSCCPNSPFLVPSNRYHICTERIGVVSLSLEKILSRRRFYKQKMKESEGNTKLLFEAKQSSLKWMLVTSFGYLGYRNAKFGKLESHEAVTAFGREKLLIAKEISEDKGYNVLHAITDCIFLQHPNSDALSIPKLNELCEEIQRETGVDLGIEALFSWMVFPPSKQDPNMPVMNRYFGRYLNGSIKVRGLFARRKDIPMFIRASQIQLLEIMDTAENILELKSLHPKVDELYQSLSQKLKSGEVHWTDLLLRKTISKSLEEYEVENATSLSLQDLKENKIEVQAGEKIRYLVLSQKDKNKAKRYASEEKIYLLGKEKIAFDVDYYEKLLIEAFEEAWQYFSPKDYFLELKEKQRLMDF